LVNGFGEARSEAAPEGPRVEARRAESGAGVLGEGTASPSHQLEDLEERCKLSSRVRGGTPAAKGLSRILNTQDDLSGRQDYGSRNFNFLASRPSGRARGRA